MLASVYSYRVMVKSVSSCCVRGRRVLSNPVTYLLLVKIVLVALEQLSNLYILIGYFSVRLLKVAML